MAKRTIYISSMSVPIYGGWRCPYCEEKNFSNGAIVHKAQMSTSSFRNAVHEETKKQASYMVQAEWMDNAINIMLRPREHAPEIRSDLFFQNTNCTNCGKKPKWDRDTKYVGWFAMAIIPAIFAGIMAFALLTSIVAWIIFLCLLSIIIYAIYIEIFHKKYLANLPEKYVPIMGTMNEELIKYAMSKCINLPKPDDVLDMLDTKDVLNTDSRNITIANAYSKSNKQENNVLFCRKCGAELVHESDFCHKCGAPIIK